MVDTHNEKIQEIVVEVIRRLAVRMGADGRRGTLITILTGATAAFNEALRQIRYLSLDGWRVQLVFSKAAEDLYGQIVRDQLAGFPHIDTLNFSQWMVTLEDARAVVVPLMSMNTVSKIASLIADNVTTNIILHGLFMGKPVIAAANGADPYGEHWQKKMNAGTKNQEIRKALSKQLEMISGYGCRLMDIRELRNTLNLFPTCTPSDAARASSREPIPHSKKMVTAADIRHAHQRGADLCLAPRSLITPLAADLAMKYGVALLKS
jgi:hypothetical protein